MNTEDPIIYSGPAEVLASGAVLSFKGHPIDIYLPKINLKLRFVNVISTETPQVKIDVNEKKMVVLNLINFMQHGLNTGPQEPMKLGDIKTTDGRQAVVMAAFRTSNVSSVSNDYLLNYSIYLVLADA